MTSSYGQLSCASGWELNGGKCYLINPGFNSGSTFGGWNQCNSYCQKSYLDASMLCIQDGNQNNWLTSKYGAIFWVGYTDMPPYGGGKGTKQYGWVTGCSSTYTNWANGEPNNLYTSWADGEDYATMQNGLWYDASPFTTSCGCEYYPALTKSPSYRPTVAPSSRPSSAPSSGPTVAPSYGPTVAPSYGPTVAPSSGPTIAPSYGPTVAPSYGPTVAPSYGPTVAPSYGPTVAPSYGPPVAPSYGPTVAPSSGSTSSPTVTPSEEEVHE